MKLKKFLRKYILNFKDIRVSYFKGDYYQVKDLHDVFTSHKKLLEKKIHDLHILDNILYISIEND